MHMREYSTDSSSILAIFYFIFNARISQAGQPEVPEIGPSLYHPVGLGCRYGAHSFVNFGFSISFD